MINVTNKSVTEVIGELEELDDAFSLFDQWIREQNFTMNEYKVAEAVFHLRFASMSGGSMLEANMARHRIGENRAEEITAMVRSFAVDADICTSEEFDDNF